MRFATREEKALSLAYKEILNERLPDVQDASFQLQRIMDIPQGGRMMGRKVVHVWQMPQKRYTRVHSSREEQTQQSGSALGPAPRLFIQSAEAVEYELQNKRISETKSNTGLDPPLSLPPSLPRPRRNVLSHLHSFILADLAAGGSQSSPDAVEHTTSSGPPRPRTPKLALPFRGKGGLDTVAVPEESPSVGRVYNNDTATQFELDQAQWSHESTYTPLWSLQTPIGISSITASMQAFVPSPLSPFEEQREKIPFFWDSLLSKRVHQWLDDKTTVSMQSNLMHLVLGSTDNSVEPMRFKAQTLDRLRIIRLTISEEAETEQVNSASTSGPPKQLDWMIFEIKETNAADDQDEEDEEEKPLESSNSDLDGNAKRYCIFALPSCALTEVKDCP